ncbi:PDZ domain-containing protein [Gaetbulibacter aquiaggeris]|uniref:PDZ domain-containing protein n=1 Tax=Gaetbulibacter aquiaggeris TaxID=1735373 RepID=A0ABW7MLM3_9FLAO
MKRFPSYLFLIGVLYSLNAQVATTYAISFENAAHHEAFIEATFTDLKSDKVELRMSRTSPGRYALHEFIKNVYGLKVTDGKGKIIEVSRTDPYSWKVKGHDGTIYISYTLFANRGDGTYSQIDETHAHLNMPATFIYAKSLENKGIEVTFKTRKDLNWKVATQLKPMSGNTYYARDLQYFMDSPTEISNYSTRSFDVKGQTIHFVLHHNGTEVELDTYFEKVKKVVLQEETIFGELPTFDYGVYTFLACYIPNASGDGMEHRNSTILTSTRSLAEGGMDGNIGTVAHEFFHSWNVERIRPKGLEPFNFEEANMSGALWFAEGFTSYFDDLSLCRAGLMSPEDYINSLIGNFNYVWNSPGRQFFNPIEMSTQAPFVDAATSVDPVNRVNTFISYYSYGSMLGLALDLSLREKGLNLDDYMKLMWTNFGKLEKPYAVEDLHHTLNQYAGNDFGDYFFGHYIYKSDMPDMKRLLNNVGVSLTQDKSKVSFGAYVQNGLIVENTIMGSSAYLAGLENGDKIIQVGEVLIDDSADLDTLLNNYKPNDKVSIIFERLGVTKETLVTFQASHAYHLGLLKTNNVELTADKMANRKAWLQAD